MQPSSTSGGWLYHKLVACQQRMRSCITVRRLGTILNRSDVRFAAQRYFFAALTVVQQNNAPRAPEGCSQKQMRMEALREHRDVRLCT